MSPEKAFNVIIDAAVAHCAADTRRYELHEALELILKQHGENVTYRALGVA